MKKPIRKIAKKQPRVMKALNVSTSDFRANAKRYLGQALKGRVINLTRYGKPVLGLVAIENAPTAQ